MRVAIIGAGLAGLATAWHFLQGEEKNEVTLFDGKGVAGGASGVPLALMHCHSGARARLSFRAYEGWRATWELIDLVERSLDVQVAYKTALLRQPANTKQEEDFAYAAKAYENISLVSDGSSKAGSIWIAQAALVDSKAYLQGLWRLLLKKGARLELQTIETVESLKGYDATVLAAGAHSKILWDKIPLTQIKGQMVVLNGGPNLSQPVANEILLLPHPKLKGKIVLGSTYERYFSSENYEEKEAADFLLPKAASIIKGIEKEHIEYGWAALRASTPYHRPWIEKLSGNCWAFCGLGSKGMLWHALMAKELVEAIR